MPTVKPVAPKPPPRTPSIILGHSGDEPVYETQAWEDFHSYIEKPYNHILSTNIPGVLVEVDTRFNGGLDPNICITDVFTTIPFDVSQSDEKNEIKMLLEPHYTLTSNEKVLNVNHRCKWPVVTHGVPIGDDWCSAVNLVYYDSIKKNLFFNPSSEQYDQELTMLIFPFSSIYEPDPKTIPMNYSGRIVTCDYSSINLRPEPDCYIAASRWIFKSIIAPILDKSRELRWRLGFGPHDTSRYLLTYLVIPKSMPSDLQLLILFLITYCTTFLDHPNRPVEDRVIPSPLRCLYNVCITAVFFCKQFQIHIMCMSDVVNENFSRNEYHSLLNKVTTHIRLTYFSDPLYHEGWPPIKRSEQNKNERAGLFDTSEEMKTVTVNMDKCYTCIAVLVHKKLVAQQKLPSFVCLSGQVEKAEDHVVKFKSISDNTFMLDPECKTVDGRGYYVSEDVLNHINVISQVAAVLEDTRNQKLNKFTRKRVKQPQNELDQWEQRVKRVAYEVIEID